MDYKKRDSKYRSLIPVISIIITIIALILAVVTFLIQRGSKEEKISVEILLNDELTIYAPEEELNARFTYAGEEVAHLWKVKVKFINNGTETIVSKGNMKNIISEDGLNFIFLNGVRILKIQKSDENFKSSIAQTELNKFQIQFSQWRKNEYVDAYFYVSSAEQLREKPLIGVLDREIVDGDILIKDLTEKKISSGLFAIDYLPRILSWFFKVFYGLIILVALFLIIGVISQASQEKIRFSKWRKKNSDSFRNFLVKIIPKISKSDINRYLEKPYLLLEKDKARYKGQKIPEEGLFTIKSIEDVLISILGGVIFIIMCAFYVLMLIPV